MAIRATVDDAVRSATMVEEHPGRPEKLVVACDPAALVRLCAFTTRLDDMAATSAACHDAMLDAVRAADTTLPAEIAAVRAVAALTLQQRVVVPSQTYREGPTGWRALES